jgi:hypothetical protein
MYLDTKQEMVEVDGMLVERDALRIAEAIRDYDPNLVLLCIDPDSNPGITEEPFVVAEKDSSGNLHPVLRSWVLDDTILERIWLADQHKVNGWEQLLKLEENQKKAEQRRYQEKRDEAKDITGHVIATRKSKYTVRDSNTGDMITFFDDRPSERH